MKKLLLTLSIIIASLAVTVAQISFSHDGEMLGDTVTIYFDPSDSTLFHMFDIVIHNESEAGMNVKIAREIIQELDTQQFTFCYGEQCFGPDTDTCPNYVYIAANSQTDSADMLLAEYQPKNKIGTSIIKYTAYNKDQTDVKGSVVIKYWASPAGITEDIMKDGYLSAIYPNPASNHISLDYKLTSKVISAQVKVFNVLGSVMKEINMQLGNSKVRMDISDLNQGIYFYSVIINGDIYTTKKLIVRN